MKSAWGIVLVLLWANTAWGQARTIVLEDVKYDNEEQARQAWPALERNTPAVELIRVGPGKVLRMRGNFSTNTEWRTAWDLKGTWDLSEARELRLRFAGAGQEGVRLTIYLRSGQGWYVGHAYVGRSGRTVEIARQDFNTEGTPEGWGKIETLRLGIGRDGKEDTELLLAGIEATVRPAEVALYWNDAGQERERDLGQFVRIVTQALQRTGVDFEVVDDQGVTAGKLKGKTVAVLPLNPKIPAESMTELKRFVEGGGKLIAFYSPPDPVGELLGVQWKGSIDGRKQNVLSSIEFARDEAGTKLRVGQNSWIARHTLPQPGTQVVGYWVDAEGKVTDEPAVTRNTNGYYVGHVLTQEDPKGKEELLLTLLTDLDPNLWNGLHERQLAALEKVAGLESLKELKLRALVNAGEDPGRTAAVNNLIQEADRLLNASRTDAKAGKGRQAWESAKTAREKYIEAYAVSVPSRTPEVRAVWCHTPEGVKEMTWDESMKKLADSGFNAAIVNMSWGNGTAYPSKVLPMVTQKDELTECLAAAKKHGIALHVWRVDWRCRGGNSPEFMEKLKQEGRLQKDAAGNTLDWLCPSQEANRKLEGDAMLEVVRNYDVAGIHFDYIRYPNRTGCYCERCRQAFETKTGLKVQNWPTDVVKGKLEDAYLQFRRDNITAVVEEVRREARRLNPKVQVSAAVFWNWATARDDVGQDWKLWVEKGLLDFVCPMQYTTDPALFEHETEKTKAWVAGRIPLVPGIGATLGLSPDGTLEQVLIARKLGTAGFVLFNYDPALAREHLELLKLGATAK